MDDYYSDNQPKLIHCDNCGEDYAATYRACPFCHTSPNGRKSGSRASSSRSGNRVRTNTRGGGYGGARSPLSIIGIVLSVALVVAAIIIVIVLIKATITGGGKESGGEPSQNGIVSQEDGQEPGGEDGEDSEDGSGMLVAPDSVTLDQAELTINAGETAVLTAAIAPEGWVGQVIWASSDGAVATVDQSGVITYVAPGDCTITASAGGVTAGCTVHCAGDVGGDPGEPAASSIVITAYGNTMDGDFTLTIGEDIPFKATGGDGANYEWSIADTSIATVDASGNCTPVSSGKTTMTVTSGGESTTVIIRVK